MAQVKAQIKDLPSALYGDLRYQLDLRCNTLWPAALIRVGQVCPADVVCTGVHTLRQDVLLHPEPGRHRRGPGAQRLGPAAADRKP